MNTKLSQKNLVIVAGISFLWIIPTFFLDLKPNSLFVRDAGVIVAFIFFLTYWKFHPKFTSIRKSTLATIGMTGFALLMVPFYNVFCDVTGINGKVDLTVVSGPKGIDHSRVLTVEFDVTKNRQLPWDFRPTHKTIILKPGEIKHTSYIARNTTKKTMTVQAIPSITPGLAASHFKKVQCFCFDSQTLQPGETKVMDLRFYLDPKISQDIKRLTLSYTLFDISGKSEDD